MSRWIFALLILTMGTVLALVGVAITGDFSFLAMDNLKLPGLGYALLDVGVGACIVFLIVDQLLLLEKRSPWKGVQSNLRQLIQKELDGIARDLVSTLNLRPSHDDFEKTGRPEKEWTEWSRKRMLENLAKFPNKKSDDIEEDLDLQMDMDPDFIENYLLSFVRRKRSLRDLTYWAARVGDVSVLPPEFLNLIIELEQDIDSLCGSAGGWLRCMRHPQPGSHEDDPYMIDWYLFPQAGFFKVQLNSLAV